MAEKETDKKPMYLKSKTDKEYYDEMYEVNKRYYENSENRIEPEYGKNPSGLPISRFYLVTNLDYTKEFGEDGLKVDAEIFANSLELNMKNRFENVKDHAEFLKEAIAFHAIDNKSKDDFSIIASKMNTGNERLKKAVEGLLKENFGELYEKYSKQKEEPARER